VNELWIVYQYYDDGPPGFQGIFSSKEKAVAACVADNFCVAGPVFLDQELPLEKEQFPLCWYPHLEAEPQ